MKTISAAVLTFVCSLVVMTPYASTSKPNVVLIMADDLGYNDVSYRGSNEIPTPNIDALAYNGAILNRFYTPPLCTPSRASLMTGKYPMRTGMQHFVIVSDEPWALSKKEKIMPQFFKDVGYKTSLIGKWHLGFYQKQYVPTERGYDSFFGYLGPYISYYDYSLEMFDRTYAKGYDMRRNLTVARDFDPIYVTDLFTNEAVKVIKNHDKKAPLFLTLNHLAPHAGNEDKPMEAPEEEINKFSHIGNTKRRTLAAMVSVLDRGVGQVVKALKDADMLNNTLIVFYSDNGAPTVGIHSTNGSNFPLRGQKHSGWEGGIRTNAIVYAPFLKNFGVVRDQLMHVSDWLPTFGEVAGFKVPANIDGKSQWKIINSGGRAVRNEVVHIDNVLNFGSLINGNLKLVDGTLLNGMYDGWLSSSGTPPNVSQEAYASNVMNSVASKAIGSKLKTETITNIRSKAFVTCTNTIRKVPCNLLLKRCLFNIVNDPCEENNIANVQRADMRQMETLYRRWKLATVPTRRKMAEKDCDPINFNKTWNWWHSDSVEKSFFGLLST